MKTTAICILTTGILLAVMQVCSAQATQDLASFQSQYLHQSTADTEVLHVKRSNDQTYVFGTYAGITSFENSADNLDLEPIGNPDLYVLRYDENFEIALSFSLGALASINGMGSGGIEVDNEGNIYLAGSFSNNVNFNPLGEPEFRLSAGGRDAFLAKYDAQGVLQWVNTYGTLQSELMTAIALGNDGQCYAALRFSHNIEVAPSDTALPDPEPVVIINEGGSDAAVLAFDLDGNYQWNFHIATPNDDDLTAIDARHTGGVYAGGRIDGSGSPITEYAMYMGSLNEEGLADWEHSFENPANGNRISGFEVFDDSNFFYVHGEIQGITNFDIAGSNNQEIIPLFRDPFVAKYESNTLELQYARTIRSSGLNDFSAGIEVTGGRLWWVGSFDADAIFAQLTAPLQAEGTSDLYLAAYNDTDGSYIGSQRIGGPGAERLEAAQFGPMGALTLGGHFAGTIGLNPDAAPVPAQGNTDAFIALFSFDYALNNSSEALHSQSSIEAFPVPTNNVLQIKGLMGDASYTLMDLTGKVLDSGFIGYAGSHIQLNLTHAVPGFYLLAITDQSGKHVLRVAKQ